MSEVGQREQRGPKGTRYFVFFLLFTPQTQTHILVIMAEKNTDYSSWTLEELRAEAERRSIVFVSKDGVRTLTSKLRVHDRLMGNPCDDVLAEETELGGIEDNGVSNLSFQQRLEMQERQLAMLDLQRKMKLEERDAERERWE